jgi:hypothetical protein
VIELNAAGSFRCLGDGGGCDLSRCIEELENPLTGSHGRLQDVVLFAEILDGPEEALGILDKRNQNAQRGRAADDVVAAEPDDTSDCDRREDFDHRIVNGVRQDRVFERVHVDGIHFGKLVEGAFFAIEQLQHNHAAHVLLQVCVDSGDGHANPPIGIADPVTEKLSGDADQRHHGKRDQSQLPVHAQHDGDNAGQHEDVFEN